MAVKLAALRRAEVAALATSPGKLGDAKRLGAGSAVSPTDAGAMARPAGTFDLLISAAPRANPTRQ